MSLFKRLTHITTVITLIIFLGSCSADLDNYQSTTPRFDLFGYFEGNVKAWGMVQDYTEQQTRRFEVKIIGTVEGNTLTLVEDFAFDDGELDQRTWVINKLNDGSYQGKAEDILGVAIGQEQGNALQWRYDFELKTDDSTITVAFDDWLYRQDEKHVFNLTKIKKFGIEVGTITLFFQKQP